MKHNVELGKSIKYHRIKKGFTQQQLADRLGISWEMVSRYETGKSSPIRRLFDIANALNISPSQLLQDSYISSRSIKISIPYFTDIPQNMTFEDENTDDRYIAPLWILEKFPNAFCIKGSLVNINVLNLQEAAILYLTPANLSEKRTLYYVYAIDKNLVCDEKRYLKPNSKLIGGVIAIEKRFI